MVVFHVTEHRWLDEEALVALPFATHMQFSARLLSRIDQLQNLVHLHLTYLNSDNGAPLDLRMRHAVPKIYLGSLFSALIEWIADFASSRAFDTSVNELIVDTLLYIRARSS